MLQISPPQPNLRRLTITSIVFALLGCCALLVDLPTAKLAAGDLLPGDLRDLLRLSEGFAHGLGIVVILVACWLLDRERRRCMWRLVGSVVVPIAVIHLCKLVVVRPRPRTYFVDGVWQLPDHFSATFQPLTLHWNTMAESDLQSWPSGHTAAAVGFAVGLSWLYPHGRWLFITLATLAALQRIDANAHFLSDTLFAASISLMTVQLCWRKNWLTQWYARVECGPSQLQIALEEGEAPKKVAA